MAAKVCVAILTMVVSLAGCSSGEPVALTGDKEAAITAEAVEIACMQECSSAIFVRDQLFTATTRLGSEVGMPASAMAAIDDALGGVEFVDLESAEALFGDDGLVNGGEGVLISVGPIERLAADVVGIEVAVQTALDGGYGQVIQFRWVGGAWEPATSEDTGITVTSWVS